MLVLSLRCLWKRPITSVVHTLPILCCGRSKSSYYLQGHDYQAEAYEPVRKAISNNTKLLVFGCLCTSPGFTTTHVAEIDTGISKRMIALVGMCKPLGNKTKVFRRKHGSCCSKAYSNYYANYIEENLLRTSRFGLPAITGNAQDLIILTLKQ